MVVMLLINTRDVVRGGRIGYIKNNNNGNELSIKVM